MIPILMIAQGLTLIALGVFMTREHRARVNLKRVGELVQEVLKSPAMRNAHPTILGVLKNIVSECERCSQ